MSISGTWNIIARTPAGEQKASFVFVEESGTLSGHMLIGGKAVDIFDATANGKQVAWKVTVEQPVPRTLEFNGTWSGDSMSGHARAGMFGTSPFTGSRAGSSETAAAHEPASLTRAVSTMVGSLVRRVVSSR